MIGKSKIHGFGVFAKLAHKAGDMVSIKGSMNILLFLLDYQYNTKKYCFDAGNRVHR